LNFTTLEAQLPNQISMNINQESIGSIHILTLNGRLDTMNFALLENEVNSFIKNNKKDIILDCQGLDYVSSSGLRVLLMSLNQVKAAGGKFSICNLQPSIIKIFKISGFDRLFNIFPGRNEALASYN
jgi:anti-sigma B factor antagonist